jgi:hypothetical protein
MGQYYRNTILKPDFKNEKQPVAMTLCPYNYGNGAKLMEFSWIGGRLMKRIEWLLANTFAGSNFVTVGDYADAVDGVDLYSKASEFEDSKDYKKIETTIPDYDKIPYYKYAVNLDKKEFVTLKEFTPPVFTIHPLSLLCAFGNGRGGGDFYGKTGSKSVGKWAFDRILVTNDKTKTDGFKQIKPYFKEDY